MTREDFKRTQQFIDSMFVPKEDGKPIIFGIYKMNITYIDEPDKPITPVAHFTRRNAKVRSKNY